MMNTEYRSFVIPNQQPLVILKANLWRAQRRKGSLFRICTNSFDGSSI